MNDKPGIEETKRDIILTKAELDAYQKLESGFKELAELPDQTNEMRLKYQFESIRYANNKNSCQGFLYQLINHLKLLESLQGAEIIMPKNNKLEGENAI